MTSKILLAVILTASAFTLTMADVPGLINFQGILTDNSGNNVPDGNYTMIFRIYDAPTDGNLSWAETSSVAVSGGLFSYNLGSNNPLDEDIFSGVDPDWLEITVNGEVLSSRMQIVSSPYSQNTARVTGDIETGPGEIVFVGIGGAPDLPAGIIFQDTATGDTISRYGPGGIVWVQPQPEPPLPAEAKIGTYGLVFKDVGPNHIRYGPSGIVMTDTTGDTTVTISNDGVEAIRIYKDAPGSPNPIGSRFRDNSIVAWGRVTGAGSLTNDFGVASVTRNSAGNYTITLDAAASLAGNLITTAAPELDTPPTTAGAARILYVNQLGSSPFNKVDIYITNGSFTATDNDFMFMVTAR